ncbi:MAG: hypothetical protein JWQ72_2420 [Polaromonas sp.]|nr:hypothetical protein [Polaromonas sp.]
MTASQTRSSLLFVTGLVLSSCVGAQAASPHCPTARELKPEQLYGLWAVAFAQPPAGLPPVATMRLQRHAEFSESLAGSVRRDLGVAPQSPAITGHAAQAALAGDLEEGMLLLDESSNNVNITGTWNGEVVDGSCGRLVKGVWRDTSSSAPPDAPDVAFTLRRLPEQR